MGSLLTYIAEHLKKIGIIVLIIGIVFGVGGAINVLIPWEYLTYFFKIIRTGLGYVDFMMDTTTLIAAIAISLSAQIIYITARASIKVIKYFE